MTSYKEIKEMQELDKMNKAKMFSDYENYNFERHLELKKKYPNRMKIEIMYGVN